MSRSAHYSDLQCSEKSPRSKIYDKSPKQRANQEFNEAIKDVLQHFSHLLKLQEHFFRKVTPGHYLSYDQVYQHPQTGQQITFKRDVYKKDLRMLYKQVRDEIKGLKALFRKKKSREVVNLQALISDKPDGWVVHLKGQNRPSVATPNLVNYLSNENFGTVNPPQYDASGNLMVQPSGARLIDGLKILKSGYGLKAAFALLFFHAIRVADVMGGPGGHQDDENHRKNYFTPAMRSAFGTNVTPYRYACWGPNGFETGEQEGVKIPNIEGGFDMGGRTYSYVPMSTIQYLASGKYSKGPEVRINDQMAHLTVVQTILNLNIKDNDDLEPAQGAYFENPANVEEAVREYLYARDVRQLWVEGMKPKTDLRRKAKRKSPRSSSSSSARSGSASPLLGGRGGRRGVYNGSASPL